MTRKQRIILIGAAATLAATTLKGLDYVQGDRVELGSMMLTACVFGWAVLVWRLIVLRRADDVNSR
ncbi:MAG: hypothetical protein KDC45_15635 [Bacteroidetes bacterium]|nr:hypothetical protein [Bacteroidota bacterium]